MYEKVKAYVEKYAMLNESDRVIVGISGGADSVCLLCVLQKLREEYGFSMIGVHVNHGLRGADADADETYVARICERAGIPLEIYRVDVKQVSLERGLSAEEAGREVRREAFEKAMKKYVGTKIALAHHMNDNAETVLLNMMRGTGLKGMAGIRPVNGVYIRPLLGLQRNEIEKYLIENQISYCIDQTNLEDIYTRNRIRNHVVPYMEQHVNEKSVLHIHQLSEQMSDLREYIEAKVMESYGRCVLQEESCKLDISKFQKEDKALKPYILKKLLCAAAGREKDIDAVHVHLLEKLMEQQTGRQVSLPYGMTAVKSYDSLIIGRDSFSEKENKEKNEPKISMRVFECDKLPDSFPQSPYTKWFDYDIIKNAVVMRNRESGDYITIDDKGNTQKIKKYFVNAKIPKEQRESVLLAADGNHIMWIVGYRQNQAYQVSEHTKRILEIKIERGKEIE